MTGMLRRLLHDSWVLAIAAAIAIGYAAVRVLAELATVVMAAFADEDADGMFVFDIAGRDFAYQKLLASAVTLVVVGALAAWLLARGDRE